MSVSRRAKEQREYNMKQVALVRKINKLQNGNAQEKALAEKLINSTFAFDTVLANAAAYSKELRSVKIERPIKSDSAKSKDDKPKHKNADQK
jgi:hypothetical protein